MIAFLAASARAQEPLTVPERSGWERTSTHAEVLAFLDALGELPHADRVAVETAGKTGEGRSIALVTARLPQPDGGAPRLRVLVNANIHAGEVEGKEAVQMILREIASGEHEDLLRGAELLFVPIYNADGNERIDRRNRSSQNGPAAGVGERANAQGLDLNRDFVKAESPECRTLLALFRRLDPHVFMDLHTTNGSYHGYHLTYSPSLATNVDAGLDAFARGTLLPAVRTAVLERHGLRVFDYGNFTRGDDRRWETYDHRPRFGTNYYGLRNRLAVLSEAYSYLDFESRVRATRAFVLEVVRAVVENADRIRELCEAADERLCAGAEPLLFGFDSELVPGEELDVLVGDVERVELSDDLGTRLVARPEHVAERMLVRAGFRSRRQIALPWAWVVLAPSAAEVELLRAHGIELRRLTEPARASVEAFVPRAIEKARRPFEGHLEVALSGEWMTVERELPAGALLVPARQRLGRVAAQLLEAQSEDSLSTWNLLEARTSAGADGAWPVLRLTEPHEIETEPLAPLR